MEFRIEEIDPHAMVIEVDGGLNHDTAPQFVESIEKLIAAGMTELIINCEKLSYISSYGAGVLMSLHRKMAERGGNVKLASVHTFVIDVLRVTRMDSLFDIYPDVNQAKLAFRKRDEDA